MIDQCHRGRRYDANAEKPRPIFAAMHNWKECEKILAAFRKQRQGIIVDYKYGPRTTKRRGMALDLRRQIKGQFVSAFVAYPARLMVKKDTSSSYEMFRDFSKEPVFFK